MGATFVVAVQVSAHRFGSPLLCRAYVSRRGPADTMSRAGLTCPSSVVNERG